MVVYHVSIVANGLWLLEKFWPLVIGLVLRTAGPIMLLCLLHTYDEFDVYFIFDLGLDPLFFTK